MAGPRGVHTATLLTNGKVLVAGGQTGSTGLASAELYDPAANTWTAITPMGTDRVQPTATLLTNGQVLVAGGLAAGGISASAELYDPATGSWTLTGSLATGRYVHTATLLQNGKVLAVGGFGRNGTSSTYLASAELYDPATGLWTATRIHDRGTR